MEMQRRDPRIEQLEDQIEIFHHTDPKQAEKLCETLKALGRELNDKVAVCVASYYQTTLTAYKTAPRDALERVLELRRECTGVQGAEHLMVRLENLEGTIHDDCGEMQEAMRCYLDGLTHAEKLGDNCMQMHLWGNIACLFMELRQYDLAMQDLSRAQFHLNAMENGSHKRYCQQVVDLNLSEIYLNMGQPEKTLAILDSSIPSPAPGATLMDLEMPAEYLRAWAQEKLGNPQLALERLSEVIRRAEKTRVARESVYETLKLEAQLCIEQGEGERALKAIEAIEQAGYASASVANALDCAMTRVAYCRKFCGKEEQLAAYERCFDLRLRYQEEERRMQAEAMDMRISLMRLQAEKEAAVRDGARLLDLSAKDELTGLANRRGWSSVLQEMLREGSKKGQCVGVVLLDVDGFKSFNDTQGHLIGDQILCVAAKALCVAEDGFFPGRFGGDEFILMCRDRSAEQIEAYLDRVNEALRAAQEALPGSMPQVTFSAGYTVRSAREVSAESELLDEADHALYHAKNSCRNCYRRYHG